MNRYDTNAGEGEVLPNKLGLTDAEAINREELVGFAQAEHDAIDALQSDTVFSLDYLYDLHRKALGGLYDFAGNLRTVNMSKDGFAFPAAGFLPVNLQEFEKNYLEPIRRSDEWDDEALRDHVAALHAELLYIHPFREGNGRIVRLFTKLILLARRGKELRFENLAGEKNIQRYIEAVQQAATGEHSLMRALFREMQA